MRGAAGVFVGGAMLLIGMATVMSTAAYAIDPIGEACKSSPNSPLCKSKSEADKGEQLMRNVVNTLLFLLGIVSTIMIIIGGMRYTTANGDSNQIQAAKSTVMYSVIGLIVAIAASVIVNFVVDRFAG